MATPPIRFARTLKEYKLVNLGVNSGIPKLKILSNETYTTQVENSLNILGIEGWTLVANVIEESVLIFVRDLPTMEVEITADDPAIILGQNEEFKRWLMPMP